MGLGLVLVLAVGALVWPGPMLLAGWLGPRMLGLPFGLGWNVVWLGVVFLALVVHHLATREEG